MTMGKKKQALSEALYFDTNAIRQLSHGIDNVEFLNLRQLSDEIGLKFFAPKLVVMEWIRQRENEITDKLIKIKKASKELARLLSYNLIKYEEPENISDKINIIIKEYLISAQIKVIPTPDIPLEKIIEMAVNKNPPFEEKREKGFRDTIILFTIINHLKINKISNAILVSADSIFYHNDITNYFKDEGLSVSVVKTIHEANKFLETQIAQVVDSYMEEKKEKIRSFLKTNFNKIVDYIHKNAEVSEYFLKGGFAKEQDDMIGVSKIKKILDVRPKEISSIFPGLMVSKHVKQEGIEPVTFSVSCEFDILVEQYGLEILFSRPKVKLSEPIEFDQIPFNFPGPREGKRTIIRNITIEALIFNENDHPVKFELINSSTY